MVKKVNAAKKATEDQQPAAVAAELKKAAVAVPAASNDNIDDIKEINLDGDESQTIKQKKENAKKMLQSVKKFNAKLKSSIERK
jgi:hypothetical protein